MSLLQLRRMLSNIFFRGVSINDSPSEARSQASPQHWVITPLTKLGELGVFLQIILLSKRFELQMPDWTQMKDILIFFHLSPIWHL